jgi:hypothetical protein
MSLSDRLANAAQERAGAQQAGTSIAGWRRLREATAEPPAPESEPSEPWVTIMIRAHVPVAAVEPDPDAEPASVCPTCGRVGELGVLDVHRRHADWSCNACGTMWRVNLPAAPLTFDQPFLR